MTILGQKISGERLKKIAAAAPKPLLESLAKIVKRREARGIYNVTFNEKKATRIYEDLESVDSAIAYEKGTRDRGAKHIRIAHLLDSGKSGYITKEELLSIGESMRAFIKEHKEPFIDRNGARVYEWERDGVRFRSVIGTSRTDSNPASASREIITFYSDRNMKKPMEFKNPKLKEQNRAQREEI